MDSILIVKIVFGFTALVLFYPCVKHIRTQRRKKKVLDLVVSFIGNQNIPIPQHSIRATLHDARLDNGKGFFYDMNMLTENGYLKCSFDSNKKKPTVYRTIFYSLTPKGKAHLEAIISEKPKRN